MSESRPDEHVLMESAEITLVSASRSTGDPREDVVRFVYADGAVYLLARAARPEEWYRNVERDRGVVLRVKRRGFRGRAQVVGGAERAPLARRIAGHFVRKYGPAFQPGGVSDWLPVRIQIEF